MASSEKKILVSYGERNKVIIIPGTKNETDSEFLKRDFTNRFAIDERPDHVITFQQFDEDWGQYVDLEEGTVF